MNAEKIAGAEQQVVLVSICAPAEEVLEEGRFKVNREEITLADISTGKRLVKLRVDEIDTDMERIAIPGEGDAGGKLPWTFPERPASNDLAGLAQSVNLCGPPLPEVPPMSRPLRLAVTADLHWGHGPRGDEATRLLCAHLLQQPPDVLLLGGDLGTAEHFDDGLPSRPDALHDLFVCPRIFVFHGRDPRGGGAQR